MHNSIEQGPAEQLVPETRGSSEFAGLEGVYPESKGASTKMVEGMEDEGSFFKEGYAGDLGEGEGEFRPEMHQERGTKFMIHEERKEALGGKSAKEYTQSIMRKYEKQVQKNPVGKRIVDEVSAAIGEDITGQVSDVRGHMVADFTEAAEAAIADWAKQNKFEERDARLVAAKYVKSLADQKVMEDFQKSVEQGMGDVWDSLAQKDEEARSRRYSAGGRQALNSTIAFIPAVLTNDLEDEKEYLPGLTGARIKNLAMLLGAFGVLHVSGKPIVGVGRNLFAKASTKMPMFAWQNIKDHGVYGAIREALPSAKAREALVYQTALDFAEERGMNATQARELAKRWMSDHRKLDYAPFVIGNNLTALASSAQQHSNAHPYFRDLADAAYRGKTKGAELSISARAAQEYVSKLDPAMQFKLSELLNQIDVDKTTIGNREGAIGASGNPQAAWDAYTDRMRTRLAQEDPALLKAYDKFTPIMNRVRADHYEARAFELTGWTGKIEDGRVHYDNVARGLASDLFEMNTALKKMLAEGASDTEMADLKQVISGTQTNYTIALRMRDTMLDLKVAQQMSIGREYLPRWLGNDKARYAIRIKKSATDPGDIIGIRDSKTLANFLNELNRPRTEEELGVKGAIHPVTGEPVRSLRDLYISQKGSVDEIRGRGKTAPILKASVDPMVIRELMSQIADSADGQTVSSEAFKRIFDIYGNDISKLVTAKELSDLGITNDMVNKVSDTGERIPISKLRGLINAIAMPRSVDSTMHRTNVLGYAPSKTTPGTNVLNPKYESEMAGFLLDRIKHMEGGIRTRAEESMLRRTINSQILDLTTRNIAPRYVAAVSSVASGINYTPYASGKIWDALAKINESPLLRTLDSGLSLVGSFMMMGFNVPAGLGNVNVGYLNTATEVSARGGNVAKLMGKGHKEYLRNVS